MFQLKNKEIKITDLLKVEDKMSIFKNMGIKITDLEK